MIDGTPAAGYRHAAYAATLRDLGTPRHLPAAGGWIIERVIPSSDGIDAMGCYPLFACTQWASLPDDIEALRGRLVSLVLVWDPFGAHESIRAHRCFDVLRPFKAHFVTHLAEASDSDISPHHRRNARKAGRVLEVEWCAEPADHADEWVALYACLVARHDIRGFARFSSGALRAQLEVPGVAVARACYRGHTVGMVLWMIDGEVAYYHLGAYNDTGYRLGAAFLLFERARIDLRQRVRWLALGAGAGTEGDAADGLSRFKRGWATGTRTAWLAGCVLDRRQYDELAARRGASSAAFLPSYRASEFG